MGQLLFVGLVQGCWVVTRGRKDTPVEALPIPRGRPATEAIDLAHSLFPDSMIAVTAFDAA